MIYIHVVYDMKGHLYNDSEKLSMQWVSVVTCV